MTPRTVIERLAGRGRKVRRERELGRIGALPRREKGTTDVAGERLVFIDGPSFVSAYRAIFERHVYRFVSENPTPRIIDCGANVGLGVVYWKGLFPGCRITAFEPDDSAFEALTINCAGYQGVELIQAAVWVAVGNEAFMPDGADAGRLSIGADAPEATVPTVRLHDHLGEHVALLKLDIEGAEVAVLEDCSDRLDPVDHLFVEYHGFADREQDLDVLLGVLTTSGFRWHIHTEYAAPTPFLATPSDNGMDQRLNIFASRHSGSGG